jgi:hypothetical protein
MQDRGWPGAAWLVEVDVALGAGQVEARYFAVAASDPASAMRDILRFPGLKESDARTVIRPLEAPEIKRLKLKAGGIRPFIGPRSP